MITSYDNIIGHKNIIKILNSSPLRSTIFEGRPGIGKSTLAYAYIAEMLKRENPTISTDDAIRDGKKLGLIQEANGTMISTSYLRSFRGRILILNEIQYLNKKQQQLFLDPLEHNRFILIATTTEPTKSVCLPALLSRCRVLYLKPPNKSEIIDGLSKLYPSISYDNDNTLEYIINYNNSDIRKLTNDIECMSNISNPITKELVEEYYGSVINSDATVSSLKSALQKSIRGSDPDAACMYALTMLRLGELEQLCRRLRVIASEDIGLCNNDAVLLVNSCIDNALNLGMPEAEYPIVHAVLYMALQPKSNSVATVISEFNNISINEVIPPPNIASEYSKDYIYPHAYPNNYVYQNYKPLSLYSRSLYIPGNNNYELGLQAYWNAVKGNRGI